MVSFYEIVHLFLRLYNRAISKGGNKRKQAKNKGQFKNLVNAAKQGAATGAKSKAKFAARGNN